MGSPAKLPWKAFPAMRHLYMPILSAPMNGVSGPELASSVAKAGGMGFLGAGMAKDGHQLQRDYQRAVELSERCAERLGIGLVGFTGSWLLDAAIGLSPGAIWLSFGDYADAAAKVKQAGIPLIIMVQSVEEAVKAAALGADAVVAQAADGLCLRVARPSCLTYKGHLCREQPSKGSESGGHGCGPTSTLCFVPEIIDALRANGAGNIPVLAAGGIADGRQVAAALALGAPGVVIGTRFAVTNESMLSDEKKQRYVAAKAADTRRTRLYDDLGSLNWPKGIDGRIIDNDFSNRHGTAAPVQKQQRQAIMEELAKGANEADLDVVPLWCGAGVGLIQSIESAEDVVKSIWAEAKSRLDTLHTEYVNMCS